MAEPNESYELETLLSADAEGPALPIDELAAKRMIAGALDAAALPKRSVRAPRRRMRRAGWLLAAALVVTGSAAAMYRAQLAREEANAERERARSAYRVRANVAPKAVAAPVAPAQAPPSAEPVVDNVEAAPSAVVPAVSDARPSTTRSLADLLERANRLRGAGDYRAAERTYVAVIAQNASGPAAYAARVAAAELRLEQLGDPKGALRVFEQALRANPSGALAPEIYEGMAQADRALGRNREERAALRALLEKQASGPAAERARARLQALDPTP